MKTLGRGQLTLVGPVLQPGCYTIALPAGSVLREPIDRALLEASADGAIDALTTR